MKNAIGKIIIGALSVSILGFLVFDLYLDSRGERPQNQKEQAATKEFAPHSVLLNNTRISLEIASNTASQIKGLSGRTSLPEGQGLLFIFSSAGFHGFWMKEMNFPIDIIWIDDSFKVVTIKADTNPQTYPKVFYPVSPARYVLEVNAGVASSSSLKEGEMLVFD